MIYELPELYDAQYRSYRDDLAFYRRVAEDYGGPVLELGAGTARVSATLGKAGHRVVAVELSDAMIRAGRARIREAGLKELINVRQGDMRDLTLGTTFPAVIAPFNTLAHAYTLQDQDATFKTVKTHLAPGGVFAFDLFTPNFGALGVMRREAVWDEVGGPKAELFLVQLEDKDKQLITTHYYLDEVENGILRRQTARLVQRYFYRFELERALLQAGFRHLAFFGGFERQRYRADAPHMVVLAK